MFRFPWPQREGALTERIRQEMSLVAPSGENGWKWLEPADRPPPPPSKTLKDSPHQRDRKKPRKKQRKKQRKREKTQQRESFHNNSLRYHPSPTFTFETQLQRVVFKPWLIHWQSHFVDWILAREIHHFTSFHLILRLQSNCKRVTTTKTIVSSFFGCLFVIPAQRCQVGENFLIKNF